MADPVTGLERAVRDMRSGEEWILERQRRVAADVLARSRYLLTADFALIHPGDLRLLFESYDEWFFGGACAAALNGRSLDFRLSRRMTKAGGKTTRWVTPAGQECFEIAVATDMLFENFKPGNREVSACGIVCASRLDGLQRIFEHELVHLVEQLCWRESNCSADRFQDIAARFFGHRAHTHALVTRRERAAESNIRVGAEVTFEFEGRRMSGRVNRVTKRATVLVEDADGALYSDGRRYKVYYVPVGLLAPRE